MRTVTRWAVVVLVLVHGLIHMLGAAKGLGWADVLQLAGPIGPGAGVAWLVAAVLVVGAGVLLACGAQWWWVVGGVAVVVSQAVILTSWSDARFGTVANLVLLLALVHAAARQGPGSYRAEYRRRVAQVGVPSPPIAPVTDADLAHLPVPVATYLRRSEAVGAARVTAFHAQIHGRIRADATRPWMPFTGQQVNRYGPWPDRLFFLDATMTGLPVDVLHVVADGQATMRVKAASLVTMVDARGPAMNQAETVTLFNDLCVLAPAALIDAPVSWEPIDARHVRGTYTHGELTATAMLVFDADGDLVDFVSDDRLRASPDGSSFVAQRWSTPLGGYRTLGSRRVATHGEAQWHPPEAELTYLEFELDDITYDDPGAATAPEGRASKHLR